MFIVQCISGYPGIETALTSVRPMVALKRTDSRSVGRTDGGTKAETPPPKRPCRPRQACEAKRCEAATPTSPPTYLTQNGPELPYLYKMKSRISSDFDIFCFKVKTLLLIFYLTLLKRQESVTLITSWAKFRKQEAHMDGENNQQP